MKHTLQELYQWQALPLNVKVRMTETRIRNWVNEYGEDGVYVSFSGGKDSTVLLDIVRKLYPNVPAVFVDVPTQYPELKTFAMSFDNVTVVRPKISFMEVCEKYGFPLISKEVSESVQGARKYLTKLLETKTVVQTDRQTDRQTDSLSYKYWYDRLCGQGKYAKSEWGGYDNKYRKLRGIGEYAKRQNGKSQGREQSAIGDNDGNVDKGQVASDSGEYP